MTTIAEQIDEIIRKRKTERLPKVQNEFDHLTKVEEAIKGLDDLIEAIKLQIDQKNGPYYAMLQSDPTMEVRFNCVSTEHVKKTLKEQKDELNILKARFSRPAVQVAFVGYARQGKSQFLQSISGLSNRIIPAFDGTSCTGAVSVIKNNRERKNVHIEFYTKDEIIKIINEKIDNFFPGDNSKKIYDIEQLASINWPNVIGDVKYTLAYTVFKKTFVARFNEYKSLIGTNARNFEINAQNENEIVQYVAQYERFKSEPDDYKEHQDRYEIEINKETNEVSWKRMYYKYLAVKSATIDCPYIDERTGDAKLILVDTVGLGDDTNSEAIEKEMYRVLEEDCDAAVDLYFPPASGADFNKEQRTILNNICNKLSKRLPDKWLFYTINRCNVGEKKNINSVAGVLQQIKDDFAARPEGSPVAGVFDINGANKDEVNQKLMTPILDVIAENLDDIDAKLVENANQKSNILFLEYVNLKSAVENVISGGSQMSADDGALFHQKYRQLRYTGALQELDHAYAVNESKPCDEVAKKIDAVIDSLVNIAPRSQDILPDIEDGAMAVPQIFIKHINAHRNNIYSAFETVNTEVLIPMQEAVKNKIISILFSKARIGRIPLAGFSVPQVDETAEEELWKQPWLQTWLKVLMDEKVSKEIYPKLYDMLAFVCDYHINIEGLIEYNVSKSVVTIDPLNPKCRPMGALTGTYKEQADAIWTEIVNRTTLIQAEMRKWTDDFTLIPSHSFYARVRKFREKMVFGDENAKEEITAFYRANRMSIWRDDYANMAAADTAFGAWNAISKDIIDLCVKDSFIIQL